MRIALESQPAGMEGSCDPEAGADPRKSPRRIPNRYLIIVCGGLLVGLMACGSGVTTIGVLEVELSDAMEDTRTGFLEVLRESGFQSADEIRVIRRNAAVREQNLNELARELIEDEGVAFVLALGTPALVAAFAETSEVPIIFAMSSYPFATEVGDGRHVRRANVAGAQAVPGDELAMELIVRALPDVRIVGILVVSGDPDSTSSGFKAKVAAEQRGLEVIVGVVEDAQIQNSTQALVEAGVGAVYVTPSNLLEDGFEGVVDVLDAANVPVLTTKEQLVQAGALAAFEIDWVNHGRLVGLIGAEVLSGAPVSSLPITAETDYRVTFNAELATRFGIDLTEPILVAMTQG